MIAWRDIIHAAGFQTEPTKEVECMMLAQVLRVTLVRDTLSKDLNRSSRNVNVLGHADRQP